jgi:hypothetical protein
MAAALTQVDVRRSPLSAVTSFFSRHRWPADVILAGNLRFHLHRFVLSAILT